MIGWIKAKLSRKRVVILDPRREVRAKQSELMQKLGIPEDDDPIAWMRLHQILFDYEQRLRALEKRG